MSLKEKQKLQADKDLKGIVCTLIERELIVFQRNYLKRGGHKQIMLGGEGLYSELMGDYIVVLQFMRKDK